MKKEIFVISIGGSILMDDKNHRPFLLKLKDILKKHYKKMKFVLVCGGGKIAREHQHIISHKYKNEKEQSFAGIRATRFNAELVMQIFGKDANDILPKNMKEVKNNLLKNNVVICGALRYADNQTSDSTAAKLAHYLKAKFINITNVPGLFTSDPKKNRNATLIKNIRWAEFRKMAEKIKFKPGQHFVLDQTASKIIEKSKIKTYITNQNIRNIDNIIKNKKFFGTIIEK